MGSDNILNIDIFKDQKINFYNLFFIDLVRVFFTQNAKSIYEEIYILSNFHVDLCKKLDSEVNNLDLYNVSS